jgi:DNA-binding NarL/FixJ family response regulator
VIRVQLVEDHMLVREGLLRLLEKAEDIEIAAIAEDGEQAILLDQHTKADVLLMDLSMPGCGGIEATRQIIKERDDAKIVMLTAHTDRVNVLAALDAGAVGYLAKDMPAHALIDGVRAAAGGASPIDPRAATYLLQTRATKSSPALTGRETEVLGLLSAGKANKQIARELGISDKTVKAHLTRVFAQLGVSDRTQAALWAHEHGLAS